MSTQKIGSALTEIFDISRLHPFYVERLQGTSSFEEVPILRKQELYESVTNALTSPDVLKGVYLSPTGGSVSNYLLFYPSDIEENHLQRSLLVPYLKDHNIFTPETIGLNLFGSNMMYRSMEIFNEFCERTGGTPLPVGSACDDDTSYKLAQRFYANTLIGAPSRLMQFARHVEGTCERGQLKFEKLVFGGEMLPENKAKFLKNIFDIKRVCGIFGSAEAGIWGFQPAEFELNQYLFLADMMHVEVEAPDEHGFGEIILTNLVRKRFPLLRYGTGDLGRVREVTYEGRNLHMLEFKGREDQSFQLGGEYYSVSEFEEPCNQLVDFQIHISYDEVAKKDRIQFSLVAYSPQYVESYGEELKERIRSIVQSEDRLFTTEISFVDLKDLKVTRTSRKVIRVVDDRSGS